LLDEQLKKLQTDHIDFYLLHSLNLGRWREIVLKHNLLAKAAEALADGRIRHLGFSMHDDFACFEEIVDGSDLWSFCQIQYNYMDTENQAGTRGLKYAAGKGLAVVVMEPLLGGAWPILQKIFARSWTNSQCSEPQPIGRCNGSGISPRFRWSSAA